MPSETSKSLGVSPEAYHNSEQVSHQQNGSKLASNSESPFLAAAPRVTAQLKLEQLLLPEKCSTPIKIL